MNNNIDIHVSKVGKGTDAMKLASSIIFTIKSGKVVDVIAIGVNTISIANKALILANTFASQNDLKLQFVPSFKQVIDNYGENRTAIVWRISAIC